MKSRKFLFVLICIFFVLLEISVCYATNEIPQNIVAGDPETVFSTTESLDNQFENTFSGGERSIYSVSYLDHADKKTYKYSFRDLGDGNFKVYKDGVPLREDSQSITGITITLSNGKISGKDLKKLFSLPKKESALLDGIRVIKDKGFFERFKEGGVSAVNIFSMTKFLNFWAGARQYTGWGAYATLFTGKDEYFRRRNEVSDKFCSIIIIGSQQCFKDFICNKYSDKVTGDEGILYARQPNALRAAAYINAQKAQTIVGVNATEHLYLVEYAILNPENNENIQYRLKFKGQRTFNYPGEWLSLGKGDAASFKGSNAIVPPYTTTDYDEVCIEFQRPFQGQTLLCNKIIEKEEGTLVGVVPQLNAQGQSPGHNRDGIITLGTPSATTGNATPGVTLPGPTTPTQTDPWGNF